LGRADRNLEEAGDALAVGAPVEEVRPAVDRAPADPSSSAPAPPQSLVRMTERHDLVVAAVDEQQWARRDFRDG
jgi:hypothetical protein